MCHQRLCLLILTVASVGSSVLTSGGGTGRRRLRPAETNTKPAQQRNRQRPAETSTKPAQSNETGRDQHKTSTKQRNRISCPDQARMQHLCVIWTRNPGNPDFVSRSPGHTIAGTRTLCLSIGIPILGDQHKTSTKLARCVSMPRTVPRHGKRLA